MKAEEIRSISIDGETVLPSGKVVSPRKLQSFEASAFFMREIAAQLADLNEKLVSIAPRDELQVYNSGSVAVLPE